jgi:hypothetical protein
LKSIKYIILTLCLLIGYSNLYAKNYFVSKKGNNLNIGSIYAPFKSIQFAINKLKPGDTCFIRSGWYDENLIISKIGKHNLPIVIQAYEDEKVTIKPNKYKYSWVKHSKYIFKTRIRKKISQVFENDKPQFQAAYPTVKEGVMNTMHWGNIYASGNKEVLFQHLKHFKNINGAFFNGICGRGLVSLNGKVIKHRNNKIKIQNDAFYWNKKYKNAYLGKGKGYLTGKLEFLDSPGEWYQDDKYFYYWPISNIKNLVLRSPSDSITILKSKYLEVKNIHFFCKNISLTNSSYVSLDKLSILYPTPYFHFISGFDRFGSLIESNPKNWKGKGVIISGTHNTLKNSVIIHSWGDGVTLYGEKNIIFNSKISDCDWMGTDAAVINASGKKHKIIHCTLYKSGRSIITHRKLSGAIIKFNHIYEGGLLCDDLGLTYTYDTDGQNTEIAYNWLHDNKAKHYGSGIYLDNNHKNFKIHHNVVWNCFVGLTINQRAENDLIYNNTFIKNKYTMGCCVPFGEKPAINNIITSYNITESNLKSRDQQPFYGTIQKENHFIPHLNTYLKNPSQKQFQVKAYPNKRINIKKLGAFNSSESWKAGCDTSLLPVIDIPWYQNISIVSIIQYSLLICYIILIVSYILRNHSKFDLTQKETLTILGLKIAAAFIFYILYTFYYTNRDNAEIFYYYDDALLIYKEHFFLHPLEYLKFITGFNSYSPEFTETLSQTIWWKKSLAMDWIHQLEIQTLIKLNGFIMLFSFGSIHTHSLFFSCISFFSFLLFYQSAKKKFKEINKRLLIYLSLPSILIFTSNGIKETIIVFFLSIFCASIFLVRKNGIKILLIMVSLLGILLLRAYYLLALIPGFTAIISYNYIKKPIVIFVGIHAIFMMFLLFNPWTNISENLTNRQSDMVLVADEMNVSSKYEQTSINSTPLNLIIKIPEALYNTFLRYKGDNQKNNTLTLLYSFENIVVILLIILSFIYAKKDETYIQLRLYIFSFCLIVSLFIGWTVPVVGAIVKYKAPMIMILYMTCILLIDWNRIKKELNI